MAQVTQRLVVTTTCPADWRLLWRPTLLHSSSSHGVLRRPNCLYAIDMVPFIGDHNKNDGEPHTDTNLPRRIRRPPVT